MIRRWIPLIAAVTALLAGAAWLFSLRLSGGDMFPYYSSLRADALGARALYDGLSGIEGMTVEREYRPLSQLPRQPRTIILAGLDWRDWKDAPATNFDAVELAARAGSRVVLAFAPDLMVDEPDREEALRAKEEARKAKDGKDELDKLRKKHGGSDARALRKLETEWGIGFRHNWLMSRTPEAQLAEAAPTELPEAVAWKSDLYFRPAKDSGWRVLYRRAAEPVLVERRFGDGSIILMADAYPLSNEALHKERATALLSWLVGSHRHVTFVESTLGVLRDNGVGFLARRYGLGGALALTVLLGLLYVWRRAVAFLPPIDDAERSNELALAYEPTAGFAALLRRALKAESIVPACVEAWRKSRRASRGPQDARLDAAWQARDPAAPRAETYNALVRALKPR